MEAILIILLVLAITVALALVGGCCLLYLVLKVTCAIINGIVNIILWPFKAAIERMEGGK